MDENENLHRVVGIDLGTTYSAVAAYDRFNEESVVIENTDFPMKPDTTPSVVSLDPQTRKAFVGRGAKNNVVYDPENTIIEIKREMGEVFTAELLDKFGARGIFNEEEPVKVQFDGQWLRPQEISAFILMKTKEVAEQKMGGEIRDAVVTVPAYFTEKQKKATEEAALLAGLYPRQLIPEPTAAAICYGVDKMEESRKVYLVYDLGGGTFDVSIITVEGQDINVIATSGDPRLGGGDFDDAITEWAVQKLLEEPWKLDVRDNPGAKAAIKLQAEDTKIALSSFGEASLTLADLDPRNPPTLDLTRSEFEKMIELRLEKALNYVDTAIKAAEAKAGLTRDDIDAILLVGGSSRIPRIKEQLLDYFERQESFLKADMNPDAVVARGAAIMAMQYDPSPAPFEISKQVDKTLVSADVEDVANVTLITEHSLGVGVQDGLMSRIIDQGTNIPVSVSNKGYTNPAGAKHIEAPVYQGESDYQRDNTLIGTLRIGPLEPKEAGYHAFEVSFSLDRDGLLSMSVLHLNENRTYEAKFEQQTGIGGPEALAPVRSKLVSMYGHGLKPEIGPRVGTPTAPPPPPPPPDRTPDAQPEADAAAGEAVKPPPPSAEGAVRDAVGEQQDILLKPSVEVPAEFAGSVRRARKLLRMSKDAELLAAYNALVAALNAGAEEEDLEDLDDELVDVYRDAKDRLAESVVEPAVEVPAQFRGTVRRARKLLLQQTDAELLEAFNAFTKALNGGAQEEDLEELADELADIYHDTRRKLA